MRANDLSTSIYSRWAQKMSIIGEHNKTLYKGRMHQR